MSTTNRQATALDTPVIDLATPGRLLYAVPFVVFGIMHFLNAGAMAGVVPGWVPGGVFWVYATGAANLAAGLAIAVDKLVRPVALGLVAMLASFVAFVHAPGLFGEGSVQMAMTSLLKDVGLMGGALLVAAQTQAA